MITEFHLHLTDKQSLVYAVNIVWRKQLSFKIPSGWSWNYSGIMKKEDKEYSDIKIVIYQYSYVQSTSFLKNIYVRSIADDHLIFNYFKII